MKINFTHSWQDSIGIKVKAQLVPAYINESAGKSVYIWGAPQINGRVDRQNFAKLVACNIEDILSANGTFLAIVLEKSEQGVSCRCVTDRFGSHSLYYFLDENTFFLAHSYSDLLAELKRQNKLKVDSNAVFEFLYFQKLFGSKTYDEKSKIAPSASILEFSSEKGSRPQLSIRQYWNPDYSYKYSSFKRITSNLSDAVSNSYKQYTSDLDQTDKRLLLSGGLDSRVVLAAGDGNLGCCTIGSSKNNEYDVAHNLTKIKKNSHDFVERHEEYYKDIYDRSCELGGGFYNYGHAHFLCLEDYSKEKQRVFFHGHGFDYLFQGAYLPLEAVSVLNRSTYLTKLQSTTNNFAEHYLRAIKYRTKGLDLFSLVKDSYKDELKACLLNSIEEVYSEAKSFTDNYYDCWDYLQNRNVCRHFTHLNLLSMRAVGEERTVAFDNDIYKLYFQCPVEYRKDAKILKALISRLSPEIGRFRNANTNMRADWSPLKNTVANFCNLTYNKMFKKPLFSFPPSSKKGERSWPSWASYTQDTLTEARYKKMLKTGFFDNLEYLDMDKIMTEMNDHFSAKSNYGAFVSSLMTIKGLYDTGIDQ